MANCGSCGASVCTCSFVAGATTTVFGSGLASAYQARPDSPQYRYAGHIFQGGGGQLFQANTDTVVQLPDNALTFDNGDMATPGQPTRLTAPIDGYYLITAFAGRTDESFFNVWVARNGVVGTPLVKRSTALPAGANAFLQFLSMTTLVRLSANDYIELYIRSGALSILLGLVATGSLTGVDCCPYLAAQWIGA